MTEKKYNELQDDSYYDQLIKERIGQALRNHSQEEKLDLAQLEAWVEADRQRRKAKITRYVAIACCILIFCTGMFSIKYMFSSDDTMVIAGKNDDKVHESGNNAVVKPGDGDGEENTGVREVYCDSWEGVKNVKQQFPRMLKPHYIPEGYTFNELLVEYTDLMENYTFKYSNGKDALEITQVAGTTTTIFNQYNRKIRCNYGDLLIMEDETKTAGCKIDNGVLFVLTKDCSDSELVKIINQIK